MTLMRYYNRLSRHTMRPLRQRFHKKTLVFLLIVSFFFMYALNSSHTPSTDVKRHNRQGSHFKYIPTHLHFLGPWKKDTTTLNSPKSSLAVYQFHKENWDVKSKICDKSEFYPLSLLTGPPQIPLYVFTPEEDKWISGNIKSKGEWKGNWTQEIVRLLKEDEDLVFIDIGANLGMFTLAAAKAGHRVIAIDCMLSAIKRLCASVANINVHDRVTIVYNAVSKIHGHAKLQYFDGNKGGTRILSVDKNFDGEEDKNTVSTVLMDDLIEYFNISKVVVKLSVEGHEMNVLQGAELFFRRVYVKYVIIDFAFHRRKLSAYTINDFFKKQNMVAVLPNSQLNSGSFVKWPSMVVWKNLNV